MSSSPNRRALTGTRVVLGLGVFALAVVGYSFLIWVPAHPLSQPARVSLLDEVVSGGAAEVDPTPVRAYEFENDAEGWEVVRGDATMEVADGVLKLRNRPEQGMQPSVIRVKLGGVPAASVTHVAIRIRIDGGEGRPRLGWTRSPDSPDQTKHLVGEQDLDNVAFDQWSEVLVPVVESPQWKGTIYTLDLTPMRFPGIASQIDHVRLVDLGGAPRRTRIRMGRETRDGWVLRAPQTVDLLDLELNRSRTDVRFELACLRGEGFRYRVEGSEDGGDTVVLDEGEVSASRESPLVVDVLHVEEQLTSNRWNLRFQFEELRDGAGSAEVAVICPLLKLRGPEPRGPNLILISLDTLRADHLGCYGYDRPTSPFLDRVASAGTLFENAVSQAPETLASTMSLLTGRYPSNHGVFKAAHRLTDVSATMAHHVRKLGYQTAGFVEGGFVESSYGFDLGFDSYHDGDPREKEQGGDVEATFARARRWIELHDDKRFFAFIQTYQIHTPYNPPERFREKFVDPEYDGILSRRVFTDDLAREVIDEKNPTTLTDADREHAIALYDAEIAYVDSVLESFFEFLGRRGRLQDTLVVITSDHGEDLGDVTAVGVHGHSLHRALTHVPLIIHGWTLTGSLRVPRRRLTDRVGLVDVAPTMLEIALVPEEAREKMHGVSLRPLLMERNSEGNPVEGRELYSEDLTNFKRAAVHEGRDKLIHTRGVEAYRRELVLENRPGLLSFYQDYTENERFDLGQDPAETRNLYGEDPERDRRLKELIDRFREQMKVDRLKRGSAGLSPDEVATLKALGYLTEGETANAGSDDDKERLWRNREEVMKQEPRNPGKEEE